MKIGDEEYKCELKKYLEENRPEQFPNMIASMSWYINTRKQFIQDMANCGRLEPHSDTE
jgi:hypothetical protein